jgi:hypothetical protein
MKSFSEVMLLGMMEDTGLTLKVELRITGTDTRVISDLREILDVLFFGTRTELELPSTTDLLDELLDP